jgi:hypothetical protein
VGYADVAVRRRAMNGRAGAVAIALALAFAPAASAAPGDPLASLDATVARFWAPEIGGAARPHFIRERTLAFEARLGAMAERTEGNGEGYEERHVRDALERHVAEDVLAALAEKLIAESPLGLRPTQEDLARIEQDLAAVDDQELGGRSRVAAAAAAEELDLSALDAVLERQTMAAWYVDRAITPILQPSEEHLREVFRSSAHPFRGQAYEPIRAALKRWLVAERLRVAEGAFFQAARAHIIIIVAR